MHFYLVDFGIASALVNTDCTCVVSFFGCCWRVLVLLFLIKLLSRGLSLGKSALFYRVPKQHSY